MESKKQKKTRNGFMLTDMLIAGAQIGASLIFAYLVKKVLPMKYWIIVAAVLILLAVFVCTKIVSYAARIYKFQGKKLAVSLSRRKLVVKIFSAVLSLVLIAGCLTAAKGLGALDNISGGNYQTKLITVIVKADSSYEKLKDIKGKTLGYVAEEDVNKALKFIEDKEKVDVEEQMMESSMILGEALLNGEVEAIILNEAYRGLIEDEYGTFSTDTRIIYEYEEKKEVQRTDTKIDVTEDAFNIFISGIDTYGKVSTVSRSDVNMIVTVNPTTKEILMTSIPRDYYAELASFGVRDKLTHAGIYGVEESMATLENEFDIKIHYYAKVNFTSLIKIVDALGGINVYNDQSFTSYHNHEYYPKGEIYMDGRTALEFVRERYGLANGDYDRVKNQQKVLKAMINKAISPAIITNYGDIMDAVSGSISTSIDAKDIQKLIQMQVNDMASWNMEQISVTGKGTTSTSCYSMPGQKVYVMQPDYDSVKAATQKINSVMNAK